jgi:hypothetical protein
MYELYNSKQRLLLAVLESVPGGDGMKCSMCDHVLEGYGTKMVHFAPDEEKLIEYYCSTRCIVRAYSPVKPKRWWNK